LLVAGSWLLVVRYTAGRLKHYADAVKSGPIDSSCICAAYLVVLFDVANEPRPLGSRRTGV